LIVSAWTRLRARLLALLIGADAAITALWFDEGDITLSARAGMAQIDETNNVDPQGHEEERAALLELGAGLDAVQAHHCAQALLGDLERARAVVARLQPYEDAAKAAVETK
jgi:hypothetical protein